jgi:phosphoglycolate phosphatase-like HAD superfamily hydrolase
MLARSLWLALLVVGSPLRAEPLPSWNAGPARQAIVSFVERVAKPGGPDFVPPAERIAVFDNDGTLWSEQPTYVQIAFVLDRLKALAPQHPEWKGKEPFRSALAGDLARVAKSGERGLVELFMATHAGNTSEEFARIVEAWLDSARHPKYGRPYTECIYAPMLELLRYLEAKDFEVWIVSGGGIEFLRPWAERVYGIPPQRIVGSSVQTKYELRDGRPVIVRLPAVDFVDDRAGKPVGIHKFVGRHPIAAFGNSDGDFEMLEWVTSGPGSRLGVLLHHDDAEREAAYDRSSPVGRLDRGLDEAPKRGWTIVSMRHDWKRVFPRVA